MQFPRDNNSRQKFAVAISYAAASHKLNSSTIFYAILSQYYDLLICTFQPQLNVIVRQGSSTGQSHFWNTYWAGQSICSAPNPPHPSPPHPSSPRPAAARPMNRSCLAARPGPWLLGGPWEPAPSPALPCPALPSLALGPWWAGAGWGDMGWAGARWGRRSPALVRIHRLRPLRSPGPWPGVLVQARPS